MESAVKSDEGQIRLLLFTNSNSHALTGTANLIRLNGSVKQGANRGATGAVFLSDFEISLDGSGVEVDVSQANIVVAVGEEAEVPVPANKSALIAAIAQVQAACDKARAGDKIGEYPSTAK